MLSKANQQLDYPRSRDGSLFSQPCTRWLIADLSYVERPLCVCVYSATHNGPSTLNKCRGIGVVRKPEATRCVTGIAPASLALSFRYSRKCIAGEPFGDLVQSSARDRAMKHVPEFIVTSLAGGLLIVVPILP